MYLKSEILLIVVIEWSKYVSNFFLIFLFVHKNIIKFYPTNIHIINITTSVLVYRTLLPKLRELRKWIFALKLFVITIVFTILSFKKESWFIFSTCYLLLIEEKDV